ncbi:DUF2796 domain-containing protein [Pseudomonas massiliensis]|uniref:DUF2796 domain-containing protein n=1 Tax=Pseudomonas massiliensis TaxID=522492 RepID=UPI00058B4325|nr:DUF2796 domain-containing protein [Pseudomonas massiliensis]
MRHALLVFSFCLLPSLSHAATKAPHSHGSLGAHEHGTARLDVALDGQTLALDLDSPGMNLVGFEHAPTSDADRAAVARAREKLTAPLELFNLPAAARCSVTRQELLSPLFGNAASDHDHDHDEHDADAHHEHSDVDGHFQLHCEQPQALTGLDLARFFTTFPSTHKVLVQAITPNGQVGLDATPDNSKLAF